MRAREILQYCGDFGKYQYILLAQFCLINVLATWSFYVQVIIGFVPDHWCDIPEIQGKTQREVEIYFEGYADASCTNPNVPSTTPCTQWKYYPDYEYIGLIQHLDWVCDNKYKADVGITMFYVGSILGRLMFGYLADKIGRVPVLIYTNLLSFVGNTFTSMTETGPWFSASRFIAGLAYDNNFVMMFILLYEYIGPQKRTVWITFAIGVSSMVGSMSAPWIAVLMKDWRTFLIVTTLPLLIVPFYYFGVEESALWLLSRHDLEGAIVCFKHVAQANGRTLHKALINQFRRTYEAENTGADHQVRVIDMFRTPRLRMIMLVLFFQSFVVFMSHDGLARNVSGLGVTPFVMMTFSAFTIIPAAIYIMLVQDKIGRKAMAFSSLVVSGFFTIATGAFLVQEKDSHQQDPYILVPLSMVGSFGANIAYTAAQQYATDLMPTCVRAQGLATVRLVGFTAETFSTWVLLTGDKSPSYPPYIIGGGSLFAAVLSLLLPETLHRSMPSTLAKAEEFGRDEGIFDFATGKPEIEVRHGSTDEADWRTVTVSPV